MRKSVETTLPPNDNNVVQANADTLPLNDNNVKQAAPPTNNEPRRRPRPGEAVGNKKVRKEKEEAAAPVLGENLMRELDLLLQDDRNLMNKVLDTARKNDPSESYVEILERLGIFPILIHAKDPTKFPFLQACKQEFLNKQGKPVDPISDAELCLNLLTKTRQDWDNIPLHSITKEHLASEADELLKNAKNLIAQFKNSDEKPANFDELLNLTRLIYTTQRLLKTIVRDSQFYVADLKKAVEEVALEQDVLKGQLAAKLEQLKSRKLTLKNLELKLEKLEEEPGGKILAKLGRLRIVKPTPEDPEQKQGQMRERERKFQETETLEDIQILERYRIQEENLCFYFKNMLKQRNELRRVFSRVCGNLSIQISSLLDRDDLTQVQTNSTEKQLLKIKRTQKKYADFWTAITSTRDEFYLEDLTSAIIMLESEKNPFPEEAAKQAFLLALQALKESLKTRVDKELNKVSRADLNKLESVSKIAAEHLKMVKLLYTSNDYAEKGKAIADCHDTCSKDPLGITILKILAVVFFAAVGAVIGSVVGALVLHGAGAFAGAFVGAYTGAAWAGAMVGITVAGASLGLGASSVAFFAPDTLKRRMNDVKKAGLNAIKPTDEKQEQEPQAEDTSQLLAH
jgi:hypothetical protein